MDYQRFFPELTRRAIAYDPPGSWIPPRKPVCIRLNSGYPAPAAVPVTALREAATHLILTEHDRPFQYVGSAAFDQLAYLVRQRLQVRGIPVAPDELLLTMGCCQALDLTARALLEPGALVATEMPTYMEALEIFRNVTAQIVSYPVDEEGLQVALLEADLAKRKAAGLPLPRLLYTIPSGQNPTGATMSLARRLHLLRLAVQYQFLILEDDAYGELTYDGAAPTLRALDEAGLVILAGSFSKLLGPGMRVGWAVGPAPLIHALDLFKKDLGNPFAHAVVATYLQENDIAAHIRAVCGIYRDRRDRMLSLLEAHMPPHATWMHPSGGYFVWVRIPGVDTAALLPQAMAAGVAYVPGAHCYFGSKAGSDALRLSYSYVDLDALERGVEALGRVLKEVSSPR